MNKLILSRENKYPLLPSARPKAKTAKETEHEAETPKKTEPELVHTETKASCKCTGKCRTKRCICKKNGDLCRIRCTCSVCDKMTLD